MKLRPTNDLWIAHDADNRDPIPGVPLGHDHQVVEVWIDDYNQLKTLHIIDEWDAEFALCRRSCGAFHEMSVLFATTGHGDNKQPNSYLICNKCIKALKENK